MKWKCTGNQQWQEENQDSNQQFGPEGRKKQPELNEETGIQKNEERLRNLQDIFKHSNIRIIGVPEGEEEEQETENLFENIMKENFSNLAKEIEFREVQEALFCVWLQKRTVHLAIDTNGLKAFGLSENYNEKHPVAICNESC